MFDIVGRSIAAGLLVGLILLLAKTGRTQVAGLLVLFPAITLISFYFVGSGQGQQELQHVVKASVLASPVWFVFIGAMYFAIGQVDYRLALAIATAAWFIAGLVYLALTSP